MVKVMFTLWLSLLCFGAMCQLGNGRVVEGIRRPIQGNGKKGLGNIISIPGFHSYVYLKDCHQSRDSSGLYWTDYEFGNPNRIVAYNITIIMWFDKMADSVIFTTDGIPKGLKVIIAPDKSSASYWASELSANATITATIISKKKISTSISGIEGQLQ
jgi:hypothetical protein